MKDRFLIFIVLALFISVGLSGCIKKDDGGGIDAETFDIDDTGGWVIPDDLPVSLNFLPGAVSEAIEVTVSKVTDIPEDEGVLKDLAFDFGPEGMEFSQPVRMFMNFSGIDLPEGIEDYMLRIARISEDGFDILSDSEVDIERKLVSANVISFSSYTVVGRRYGMTVGANPERIAANGEDTSNIRVFIRKMEKGDRSEPTGEVVPEKNVKFEIIDEKGKKSTGGNEETNLYGYCTFEFTHTKPGTYRIRAQSTYEKLSMIVYVKVGGQWPYYEGFDDAIGPEWELYQFSKVELDRVFDGPKPITTQYSPVGGEKFIGKFTTHELVIKFDNIPEHYRVVFEFDFIAIGPWKEGFSDQTWSRVRNDPDEELYVYCSKHVSLQEEDYTGGFDENDIINTLGYDTTPLVYEDPHGEEQTLQRGDGIFHLDTNLIQHRKDSIELAITVDERGFGENTDVGQYWGIDNVYVRLWTNAWI